MALQPASGAKDLNPKQVEKNHLLSNKLSEVFRLWGYEEVSPPRVERLGTLMAGGAIKNEDIVKLVADEPLGLRPEMTASIARAACTRLSQRQRPLRLWASGTVFERRESIESGLKIEENLQCGVELIGVGGIKGEMELLSILLDSMEKLNLSDQCKPTLLIGHTSLMDLVLSDVEDTKKERIRSYLVSFDRLSLERDDITSELKDTLINLQECRGHPLKVLNILERIFGKSELLSNLKRLFLMIEPIAKKDGVELQLDPTFEPHFELYTGIVLQLICKSISAPVVIARGGRYDDLVKHFGCEDRNAKGLGFGFAIDKIRELQIESEFNEISGKKLIVAYGKERQLEDAIERQKYWHKKGYVAEVQLESVESESEAIELSKKRGCTSIDWLE